MVKKTRASAHEGNGLTLIDAPWRHKLFSKKSDPECFICRAISSSPRNDAKNLLLTRGRRAVTVLNRYPYTMGALMVAPVDHVADILQVDDSTLLEIMDLVKQGIATLDEAIHPKGYNIGINQGIEAGAGLSDHLHVHIVPRWGADTNFMSTIANSRVLAEDVDSMYRRLRRAGKTQEEDGRRPPTRTRPGNGRKRATARRAR
ncbi:MAG: HIT family protein [Rudaea sp.]